MLIMQRRQGVVSYKKHGMYVALISGHSHVFEFNETASFIWDLLKKPISDKQISKKLCEMYHVTKNQADKDAHEFVMKYTKEGLVTDSPK